MAVFNKDGKNNIEIQVQVAGDRRLCRVGVSNWSTSAHTQKLKRLQYQ